MELSEDKDEDLAGNNHDPKNSRDQSDQENEGLETAKEIKRPVLLRCICISGFLFILGCLFSMIVIKFWTSRQLLNMTITQDTYKPIFVDKLETNFEDFINYASLKNGARIIPEYSSPEFRTSLVVSSLNKQEYAISDQNSPGQCWGMAGHKGNLGVKLNRWIYPRHFSINHLNVNYNSGR